MKKSRHTTLLLSEDNKTKLEQIAHTYGYLQTRGAGAGRIGNISALMRAIAQGEMELKRPAELDKNSTGESL